MSRNVSIGEGDAPPRGGEPVSKRNPLQCSDHALLRYLERAGGFDVERLRAQIEARIAAVLMTETQTVVIEGYRFLIKPGASGPVVVTVLGKHMTSAQRLEGE